jgi:hypothetical protein
MPPLDPLLLKSPARGRSGRPASLLALPDSGASVSDRAFLDDVQSTEDYLPRRVSLVAQPFLQVLQRDAQCHSEACFGGDDVKRRVKNTGIRGGHSYSFPRVSDASIIGNPDCDRGDRIVSPEYYKAARQERLGGVR